MVKFTLCEFQLNFKKLESGEKKLDLKDIYTLLFSKEIVPGAQKLPIPKELYK